MTDVDPPRELSGITGPAALFPPDIGPFLRSILNPEPQTVPPYTHTIRTTQNNDEDDDET